jgi:prepilin-type N-terminal cleavage/methylation domain-containing protein
MFTNRRARKRGWTLVEMMIAVAVFSIGAAALGSTFLFSLRSMAALSNYTALDRMNQQAMDQITQEIRQAKMAVRYETNLLEIVNGAGNTVYYWFVGDGVDRLYRLVQTPSGEWNYDIILEDCQLINFRIGQRNLQSNSWNYFPPTTGDFQGTAKVIDLSWKTSRTLPHGLVNSEDVQTAKIVIRKK